jgi:hypothetical protein
MVFVHGTAVINPINRGDTTLSKQFQKFKHNQKEIEEGQTTQWAKGRKGQMEKNKQLPSKLNIQQHEQHKKQRVNSGAPEGIIPFSLVASHPGCSILSQIVPLTPVFFTDRCHWSRVL